MVSIGDSRRVIHIIYLHMDCGAQQGLYNGYLGIIEGSYSCIRTMYG